MDRLTADEWDRLSARQCEARAKRLARDLPAGFVFCRVREHRLGSRTRHVAEFEYGGAAFALVPGGEVALGYDASRPWEPNPEERADWDDTAAEYEISQSIHEYITATTLRPRRARLTTMLMEFDASEVGWLLAAPDDPDVAGALREFGRAGPGTSEMEVHRGGSRVRLRRGPDAQVVAERAEALTHAEIVARWAAGGFRLPTTDEWEYACGGGAPTLFRWGDHAPCDRYPTDVSAAEAESRRGQVSSRGAAESPPEGFAPDWDLHRLPSVCGVRIAANPYKCEVVAEPGLTRGGDGGGTICGGAGFFVGWLTLATAYFEDHACRHDPAEPVETGYTIARRVLSLD